MCRNKEQGGRRCDKHNAYGVLHRNLQAQKQYHQRKLQEADLPAKQRIRSETKLANTVSKLEALTAEKTSLGPVTAYTMQLTPNTEKVLAQLENDGYTPYIVGGSVRDALMGKESKDVDIEVYHGTPEQIARSLRKIGQVDEVGKSFGVLKIRIGNEDFDVSLPRKDSKKGDGHRGFTVEVTPELSLYEATARRDFTINALMYSHKHGFIIDQHGGLKDLERKELRHVSEAFDEDPLRVLRGVQMSSRFGMDLHPSTIEKAQTLKNGFSELATERVQIEFEKLYTKGTNPAKALKFLKETGWDANFPGLAEVNDPDLYRDLMRTQNLINSGVIPAEKKTVYLSAMIANRLSDRNRREFLSLTTVGSDVKNAADKLSLLQIPVKQGKAALRNWAYEMPRNLSIRDWAVLQQAKGETKHSAKVLAKAEKLGIADQSERDLLNGMDFQTVAPDKKPGPWMKNALAKARQAQYTDVFRTKEDALIWLRKNINELTA